MRNRLLDFLVCPIERTSLDFIKWESKLDPLSIDETLRLKRLGRDPRCYTENIISGLLVNHNLKIFYPIVNAVPRMLVFKTDLHRKFIKSYNERIQDEIPDYKIPEGIVIPGEYDVLRTFSSEWNRYDKWDEKSYWSHRPNDLYKSMRFLLDLKNKPIKDKLVLEVGIGIGGIANYMASREESELIGIDLGYSVDLAMKNFMDNKFLHIVQASAFMPPFCENTFDFVYSHGVLHHTFSTHEAFKSISNLPKRNGRLYIWVYSPKDESRNIVRRILMVLEKMMRPILWRLPEFLQTVVLFPIIPLYIFHQNFIRRKKYKWRAKYGWMEASHAARDRFTPRYVHRHTEKEVSDWFYNEGYKNLEYASERSRPDYVPVGHVECTGVEGQRGL